MNDLKTESHKVIKIYTVGDEYLSDVIQLIGTSLKTVDIESYIFEICEASEKLFETLSHAIQRGVKVRILVDGFGSILWISQLINRCEQLQIELKVYHPIYSWRKIFKINKRNHRKIIIIDDCYAFLGSYNISSVHFSFNNKSPWQDLGVCIEGSSVVELKKSFNTLWDSKKNSIVKYFTFKYFRAPKKFKNLLQNKKIRINTSWFLRFFYWLDLLKRIRTAQSRIYIMNAYFIPHRTFLKNLAKASQRGVEVVLILPNKIDVPIVKWATPILYSKLLRSNIKIFEYSKTNLHTKSLIIDDWAIIGSHNLNHRSLIHDLECEAVITNSDKFLDLHNFFKTLRNESDEVTILNLKKISILDWIKCRFALLFKYFI